MIEKTSKGFVSSEERIKKLENIPLIYGKRTTGARTRYMRKEDFPKLASITEGGYAKDIYLVIDEKTKRVIIDDNRDIDDTIDIFDNYVGDEGKIVGVLYSSSRSSNNTIASIISNIDEKEKDEMVIVWYNGNCVIIKKYPKGTFDGNEVVIPVELAQNIIADAKKIRDSETIQDSTIMNSLGKSTEKDETFESVSAKDLAERINCKDVFSYWIFDGILNIMINTHMRNGPYKLQRINNDINVHMEIDFTEVSYPGSQKKKIAGISDSMNGSNGYISEIKLGFNKWNGTYPETKYDRFTSSSGETGVNVKFSVTIFDKNEYPNSADVFINNAYSPDDGEFHRSNVDDLDSNPDIDSWRVNKVGEMTLYNHEVFNDGTFNNTPMLLDKYLNNAGHEFGHLMGIGHAYDGAKPTDEVNESDIMWGGSIVSSNDIEMVFMAAMKNKHQNFYSHGLEQISEAIRER